MRCWVGCGVVSAGRRLGEREQRQTEVAQLGEQAVKGGLVDDGSFEDSGAVAVGGHGHPVEPGGPPGGEVPFEPDLVPARLVLVAGRRVVHSAPPVSPFPAGFRHLRDRLWVDRSLASDVVSGHHHMR